MKKLLKQIFKFGLVGIICFFIEYMILLSLVEIFNVDELVANATGFSVAVIINYILSMKMVFETNKNANKINQFVVFVSLSIVGLFINQLVMKIGIVWLSRYMDKAYMIVKFFATAIVMVFNFITRKKFLEK